MLERARGQPRHDSAAGARLSTDMAPRAVGVGEWGKEKDPAFAVCMDSSNSINHEEWAYAIARHGQNRVHPAINKRRACTLSPFEPMPDLQSKPFTDNKLGLLLSVQRASESPEARLDPARRRPTPRAWRHHDPQVEQSVITPQRRLRKSAPRAERTGRGECGRTSLGAGRPHGSPHGLVATLASRSLHVVLR
jgi:hypothetical protein